MGESRGDRPTRYFHGEESSARFDCAGCTTPTAGSGTRRCSHRDNAAVVVARIWEPTQYQKVGYPPRTGRLATCLKKNGWTKLNTNTDNRSRRSEN